LATAPVHYAVAAVTDLGRKRTGNEDAFGFSAEHGVYVVCDGMGGAAAGEVASSIAVDEVLRLLSGRTVDETAPLDTWIEETVRAANRAILSRAQRDPKLAGMGTTLAGLVTEGNRVLVFNVGDSRCYRMRGARQGECEPYQIKPEQAGLQQISLDHSLVQEQVRQGRMTDAEAACSPLRSVITRALGTQSEVEPDLFELEAEPGDIFMLCSDGLTNELADAAIESLLASDLPLEGLCASLIAAANNAGGRDNITCLLVRAESSDNERDGTNSGETDASKSIGRTARGALGKDQLKRVPAIFYRTEAGSEPVRVWLREMDPKDRRMVGEDIKTVEFGWPIGMPTCRPMGDGLHEVRTRLPGNRIVRVFF
jgi:protein phosphatase